MTEVSFPYARDMSVSDCPPPQPAPGEATTEVAPLRWGVLATGSIARSFCADLALLPDHRIAAVGSRSLASAEAFVESLGPNLPPGQHPRPRAHGSYAALASDPDVDVVYVATPHSRHRDDVMTCLQAGKAVLCEKPMTLSGDDTAFLAAEARRRGVFLAEGMWMRANPVVRAATQLAADGRLGTSRHLRADFGFVASRDSARLWQPELGASALLDIGIYPLTLANLFHGPPVDIAAAGHIDAAGVDVSGGATLVHADGAVSSISWTQAAWADNRACVSGDGGRLEFESPFHATRAVTYAYGETTTRIDPYVIGTGFAHEAIEVADCLRRGATESDLLHLDDSIDIARQMDRIAHLMRASTTA